MLLRLALRSLGRHRRRSALTLAAITLGCGIVVFSWSFGAGIIGWITRFAVEARTGAVQIHADGHLDAAAANPLKLDLPDPDALTAELSGVPGVVAVAPRIRFTGLATTGALSSILLLDAIEPDAEREVCPDRIGALVAGEPLRAEGPRAIVVGSELASSLSLKVGDSLTIAASTREGAQNALDFTVVGITKGAGPVESKRVAITRLQDARELLAMQGRATELAIKVVDAGDLGELLPHLRAAVGPGHDVQPWTELNPFLRDMVARVRIIISGVSVVLFAVVVLGVANTLLMSIFERVREIGTLLAVGMRRRRVLALFLLEAAILSAVGAALGVALGGAVALAAAARGIDFTPPGASASSVITPVISPVVVLAVLFAAVVGAVGAAFVPARRASRLDPVEALRND